MKNLLKLVFTTCCVLSSTGVLASDTVPLGSIRMHMRSSQDSDEENFRIRVLSQTFLFLEQVFKNMFADNFERFSLSIHSRGIKADETGGFVVAVDLTGTSYFIDGTAPEKEDVTTVLKDAFRMYNDLFLDILADSVDPFLSQITYAIVIVDGDSVVDNPFGNQQTKDDSGLEIWAISAIAAGGGFITILAACICFICWVGESEDDNVPGVKKSNSHGSKKSKTTANTSKNPEDETDYFEGNDHLLDARSISSQDSSKFTYNPKSIRSNDGMTFASFNTNTTGLEYDAESWRKASTINQSALGVFGEEISQIEHKRDLSHIVERDEESGVSSNDSSLKGLQHLTDRRCSGSHSGRNSLDLSGAAANVIEDLNDLSRQVAQYRSSSTS